ncbi:heterocyst development glycosyltransferase HepC [Nodularia sphaerocarpa]|uniref:heterocyst development glycosyltransferase HepC n=1 Tax=Nodularia sphaerocarpa TaxID=137816 RepID=UPI001EFA8595|nr:heterocyst development glycosyltransferase HepC [Nodularia sphaerocarpa]MDB9375583.1 sugar transferase [Nodularia sphaerocarpa CS-585]MDB9379719.1 sugar transferase [Nodularia sphaerocarpa CS-585A2]ULP72167.1 Undecaprenyl phosphate N,N'-diacetylbacillosamine 1-phosphate transferase [Nodularia sphaerocarpa UHCC 0038]
MTISLIPTLHNSSPEIQPHQNNHFSYCTLQWRRGQLLVKASRQTKQLHLASLHDEPLLVNCLKKSLVNLVSIDPNVGEDYLKLWVAACEQAGKPIFVRLPSRDKQGKQGSTWQKLIDWMAALFLLVLMSPVMLALFAILQMDSPGAVLTSEWQVGERGKVFRALKFSTTAKLNLTPLGRWMRKYDLDHLPQLWNVLRGEMSLMGSRSCTLENAVRLTLAGQQQVNQLSQMTDSWEESSVLHLDSQTL